MHRIRKYTTPKGDGNKLFLSEDNAAVIFFDKKIHNSERRRKLKILEAIILASPFFIRKYITPKGDGNRLRLHNRQLDLQRRIRKYTTPIGDGNIAITCLEYMVIIVVHKKIHNSERRRKLTRYKIIMELFKSVYIRKYTTPKRDGNLGYLVTPQTFALLSHKKTHNSERRRKLKDTFYISH